jgi:molybdopterin synthase sulfur carrier subunit
MKILYFAKLRQVIGRGQDDVEVPLSVTTVQGLIDYLKSTDEGIAAAFADLRSLKVAINQNHSTLEASLAGATEVAFFPPVTGG